MYVAGPYMYVLHVCMYGVQVGEYTCSHYLLVLHIQVPKSTRSVS